MSTPDWLVQRGGSLKRAPDGGSWYVVVNGNPQYAVRTVPASGKFTCHAKQTINGRRIESASVYATEDEALRGCLEELRMALGWA